MDTTPEQEPKESLPTRIEYMIRTVLTEGSDGDGSDDEVRTWTKAIIEEVELDVAQRLLAQAHAGGFTHVSRRVTTTIENEEQGKYTTTSLDFEGMEEFLDTFFIGGHEEVADEPL